jgi:hypothetical protein
MTRFVDHTNRHRLYSSDIDVVGNVISVNVASHLISFKLGCRYYSDAAGTPATPGAGTVVLERFDEATLQWTTITTGSPLTATDLTDKGSEVENSTKFRATASGVTVATHYQLFISGNV